jgi:hypothetical protein
MIDDPWWGPLTQPKYMKMMRMRMIVVISWHECTYFIHLEQLCTFSIYKGIISSCKECPINVIKRTFHTLSHDYPHKDSILNMM